MSNVTYKQHLIDKISVAQNESDKESRFILDFYCSNKDADSLILYVTGLKKENQSKSNDEEIIISFLDEGYTVCVADCIDLSFESDANRDYAIHKLLNDISKGIYFNDKLLFFKNTLEKFYMVPSGYYLSRNNVFWSFDKHGTDGTFEEIVNVWNNDFRIVKGEEIVYWLDEYGNRKCVQNDFENGEPVWLDENGNEDVNGNYIRIKYTKAVEIYDCVKKNGEPISMDLKMNIYYPINPLKKVPVMCLVNYLKSMEDCANIEDQPHFHGFLLKGYAGVVFDYGYVPMARGDHYDYFDGDLPEWRTDNSSGDNVTYSLQFYNTSQISTAAMRYVRYLAKSDERFNFDTEAIGVMGNSKGGWTVFLGQKSPQDFTPYRYHKGHCGETRFAKGKLEGFRCIRGAEQQPWLSYDGEELSSRANFIYPCCGGHSSNIMDSHTPMYISCHYNDMSGYYNCSSFVNLCREYDVASVETCLECEHVLCYGEDTRYGFDSYKALYDTAGFFLNGEGVKVLYYYADANGLHIKFTGSVSKPEIQKILFTKDNIPVNTEIESKFGKTMWTFIPACTGELTVHIPSDIIGMNSVPILSGMEFKYFQEDVRKKKEAYERKTLLDSDIFNTDVIFGDYLDVSKDKPADGVNATRVSVKTNKGQFVNNEFYYNHSFYREDDGNKILVKNVFQSTPFGDEDIGRKFEINISVYDTVSRDICVLLSSAHDEKTKVFDFEMPIRNCKTIENRWCDIKLNYEVQYPLEKDSKTLEFVVASTGVSEKPVYIGKVHVCELV